MSKCRNSCGSYTCTGANDKILDHFLFRNSWPTTPIWMSVYKLQTGGNPKLSEALTVHSCSNRVPGLVDQHTGIIAESDEGSVRALQFLLHANNNGMSDITTTDLVRKCSGGGGFGACGSLLLNDNNYPISCCTTTVSIFVHSFHFPLWIECRGDWPIVAGRFFLRTFTHSTIEAPELSMQFNSV